jgi:hypothetical protein
MRLGLWINKSLGETTIGWDDIEKSFKYIRRWVGKNGKWQYLYPKDILRPISALQRIFGLEEKKVDDEYEKNNIRKQYGVDKKEFAVHILEYFSNRQKWDNIFAKRENRDKYAKPIKQKDVALDTTAEKINNNGQPGLFKEKKSKEQKTGIINRSLMKKIWEIYNPKQIQTAAEEKAAESGAEAHENRSEAMNGKDNARADGVTVDEAGASENGGDGSGDNSGDNKSIESSRASTVSHQTDKWSSEPAEIQRVAEEANEKQERDAAGMPPTDLFDRSSALEDSTWDPKSKDYRYQDTGYIAGSRKEAAANSIRSRAKEGNHIDETDIDWQGIEENPRQAKQLITKSNLFGKVDWGMLQENGMTGGAGFLVDRVYASVGAEPAEDSASARHNYAIAIDGLRHRLEKCKTVPEITGVIKEIRDEMKGDFVAAREAPEVKEASQKLSDLYGKRRELEEQERAIFKQGSELDRKAQEFFESEAEKAKAKDRRKKHISIYDLPEEVRQKYNDMASEAAKENVRIRDEFREKNGYLEDEELNGENGARGFRSRGYLYDEIKSLEAQRKELYDKKAFEIIVSNPLHLAWTQLGDKFDGVVNYGGYNGSNTFYNHVSEARRGKYDNWEWAQKDKIEVEKRGQKRRIDFELQVASKIDRKGGRSIKSESAISLKNNFNLRDVQFGKWVQDDPESAKFHVDNVTASLADLSDMTGIPDDLLSMNGRLAIALGARGTGNAGWKGSAAAHYEPVERVINLTKMKGGGSLAHEWFHAFDNLISESMTGGNINQFLTEPDSELSSKQRKLKEKAEQLREESERYGSYQRVLYEKAKKEAEDAGVKFPEPGTEEDHIQRVKAAFDNLVKAMTTGDVPLKSWIHYTEKDYQKANYNFEHNPSSFKKSIRDAGSLDRAMEIVNDHFGSSPRTAKDKNEWMIITAAYYDKNPQGGMVYANNGKKSTSFKSGAIDLDGGSSREYWSSTKEMAARAFAGYVDDKLRENSRLNDYLAYATTNDFYVSMFGPTYPYPEGEERKRINAAFDQLFQAVNDTGAIRKALEAEKLTSWEIEVHKSHIRKLDYELDAILKDDGNEGLETVKDKEEILEQPAESGKTKKSFVFSNGKIWIKTA